MQKSYLGCRVEFCNSHERFLRQLPAHALDFLTQAERQRDRSLPADIVERNRRQHFHLSEGDRAFVATFCGTTRV